MPSLAVSVLVQQRRTLPREAKQRALRKGTIHSKFSEIFSSQHASPDLWAYSSTLTPCAANASFRIFLYSLHQTTPIVNRARNLGIAGLSLSQKSSCRGLISPSAHRPALHIAWPLFRPCKQHQEQCRAGLASTGHPTWSRFPLLRKTDADPQHGKQVIPATIPGNRSACHAPIACASFRYRQVGASPSRHEQLTYWQYLTILLGLKFALGVWVYFQSAQDQ